MQGHCKDSAGFSVKSHQHIDWYFPTQWYLGCPAIMPAILQRYLNIIEEKKIGIHLLGCLCIVRFFGYINYSGLWIMFLEYAVVMLRLL
ncbi:hypothetical protein U9M48_027858 [Paspalum notatum var. saurae]|uniref:Uncharacterized protein n=1 Tax=Paspalum notatum var. saurae TaxID=547442 RepID=A0AAQ3WZT9_PASNO